MTDGMDDLLSPAAAAFFALRVAGASGLTVTELAQQLQIGQERAGKLLRLLASSGRFSFVRGAGSQARWMPVEIARRVRLDLRAAAAAKRRAAKRVAYKKYYAAVRAGSRDGQEIGAKGWRPVQRRISAADAPPPAGPLCNSVFAFAQAIAQAHTQRGGA
jgi:hypothetical protein